MILTYSINEKSDNHKVYLTQPIHLSNKEIIVKPIPFDDFQRNEKFPIT